MTFTLQENQIENNEIAIDLTSESIFNPELRYDNLKKLSSKDIEELKELDKAAKEELAKLKSPQEEFERQKREKIRSISELLPLALKAYQIISDVAIKLSKSQIEKRIMGFLREYNIEKYPRQIAAILAMRRADFSAAELQDIIQQIGETSYEAGFALVKLPNKKIVLGAVEQIKNHELIPLSKAEINEYRQQVDPTKIPANLPAKDISKYLKLIATKCDGKKFDEAIWIKQIGEAREENEQKKREELIERDEYTDGMKIESTCGDIVQELVAKLPFYADKIKKLCPDLYKRKSKIQIELENERAKREELEAEVFKMKEDSLSFQKFQKLVLENNPDLQSKMALL